MVFIANKSRILDGYYYTSHGILNLILNIKTTYTNTLDLWSCGTFPYWMMFKTQTETLAKSPKISYRKQIYKTSYAPGRAILTCLIHENILLYYSHTSTKSSLSSYRMVSPQFFNQCILWIPWKKRILIHARNILTIYHPRPS